MCLAEQIYFITDSTLHAIETRLFITQLESTRSEGLWHIILLKEELKDDAT